SMNWALPVRPLAERHHFRLWNTGTRDRAGRLFWWGSGNYDLRIRWRDFSHVPDPDMDREREFISETLARSPLLDSIVLTPLPQIPREGANDKGYPFRTDGRVAVIVLRAPR
ncbi:MAG: LssY C-terminal domain-containing protein, partial [Elusimicrobia bacterium]|nr:LssY C-terminal domain-containing protein [Elusimicrobiota bacterium]